MAYDDWKSTDPEEVGAEEYNRAETVIRDWYDEYEGQLRAIVDDGIAVQEKFNAWLKRLTEHVAQGVKDRDRLVDRKGLACDTGDGQPDEFLLDDLNSAYASLAEFVKEWQTKIVPVGAGKV